MANHDGSYAFVGAQCAHTRVSVRRRTGMVPGPLVPSRLVEAVVAEWWECDSGCGMTFSPDVKPLRRSWWRRIVSVLRRQRRSSEGK